MSGPQYERSTTWCCILKLTVTHTNSAVPSTCLRPYTSRRSALGFAAPLTGVGNRAAGKEPQARRSVQSTSPQKIRTQQNFTSAQLSTCASHTLIYTSTPLADLVERQVTAPRITHPQFPAHAPAPLLHQPYQRLWQLHPCHLAHLRRLVVFTAHHLVCAGALLTIP